MGLAQYSATPTARTHSYPRGVAGIFPPLGCAGSPKHRAKEPINGKELNRFVHNKHVVNDTRGRSLSMRICGTASVLRSSSR